MRLWKPDMGVRQTMRGHSALRQLSRLRVVLLSLLFLVSAQFCYAMAHDMPLGQVSVGCPMSAETQHTGHQADKTMPIDHGTKAPVACVMMATGCIVQPTVDLGTCAPGQDFGPPPLAAAISGNDLQGVLRPPIVLPL